MLSPTVTGLALTGLLPRSAGGEEWDGVVETWKLRLYRLRLPYSKGCLGVGCAVHIHFRWRQGKM